MFQSNRFDIISAAAAAAVNFCCQSGNHSLRDGAGWQTLINWPNPVPVLVVPCPSPSPSPSQESIPHTQFQLQLSVLASPRGHSVFVSLRCIDTTCSTLHGCLTLYRFGGILCFSVCTTHTTRSPLDIPKTAPDMYAHWPPSHFRIASQFLSQSLALLCPHFGHTDQN